MELLFKDDKHESAYRQLLEEADLTDTALQQPTLLLRRQLAFLYLIALFQEDYIHYEGEAFYVEAYEELSLGGPTYLLETCMGEANYPHEQILDIAKKLLQGETTNLHTYTKGYDQFIKCAINLLTERPNCFNII